MASSSAIVFETTGREIDKLSAAFAMFCRSATAMKTWRSRSLRRRPIRSDHRISDVPRWLPKSPIEELFNLHTWLQTSTSIPPRRPTTGVGQMRSALLLAACALAVSTAMANAQSYPSRPITVVGPFPAGGPGDTVMRALSERMRQSLGQPLVIENVTGASGSIGTGRVGERPETVTPSGSEVSRHTSSIRRS